MMKKRPLVTNCPGGHAIDCTCTYPGCSRKGICCECLRHHLESDELPACCFTPEAEKTYDRSFRAFIKSRGGTGSGG